MANLTRLIDYLAEQPIPPAAQKPLEVVACMSHTRPTCTGCVFEESRWCTAGERSTKNEGESNKERIRQDDTLPLVL